MLWPFQFQFITKAISIPFHCHGHLNSISLSWPKAVDTSTVQKLLNPQAHAISHIYSASELANKERCVRKSATVRKPYKSTKRWKGQRGEEGEGGGGGGSVSKFELENKRVNSFCMDSFIFPSRKYLLTSLSYSVHHSRRLLCNKYKYNFWVIITVILHSYNICLFWLDHAKHP